MTGRLFLNIIIINFPVFPEYFLRRFGYQISVNISAKLKTLVDKLFPLQKLILDSRKLQF